MKLRNFTSVVLVLALSAAGCAQQNNGANGAGAAGGANGYGSNGQYGAGYGNAGQAGYGNGANGGGQYGYGNGANGAGQYGNGEGRYTPADLRNPASILSQRVIYFDYDSSNIKPEYQAMVNAHAALLAAYPNLKVKLEGHADERGSREYNVALSERRGYAVQDYVLLKGVKLDQVEVIGYGEEIPAVFGHDESAWGKNRRVEIRYAGE